MKKVISNSTEQTEKIGEEFAKTLIGNEVIALYGGLGMGKTAFTRGVARGLEITDSVVSPTFALVNEYKGKYPLYHFDMYRVNNWDDLYSTGFFDYLENGILIIEWSENIDGALPQNTVRISINRGETENSRIFCFE